MAGTKNKNKTLNAKLSKIQDIAFAQTQHWKTSRELLHEAIVDTYLWWREARDEPDYLDKLYEENNVTFNRPKNNKQTFTGVLKLVWGSNIGNRATYQVTLSKWNGALGVIDDEYINNQSAYSRNTKQLLLSFVADEGGLSNMRKRAGVQSEEDDEDNPSKSKKSKSGANVIDVAQLKKQIDDGIDFFKSTAKSIATVDTGAPLITTKDELVAVIARRNSKGELEILGTTHDDELVGDLASKCAGVDYSHTPKTVSLLAEAISAHSLPIKMKKLRSKLLENSKFKIRDAESNQKIKLYRRLTVRPSRGDMLVSISRTNVSVVTRVTPKEPLKQNGDDLVLKGNLVSYIEDIFLYEKTLNYITVKPSDKLKLAGKQYAASHLIEVKNNVTTKTRNLYFYNPSIMFEEDRFQADYNDDVEFTPLWTVSVTPNWLREYHANVTNIWIGKTSQNMTRNHHKMFEIKLTKKAWITSASEKKYRPAYGGEEGFEDIQTTPFSAECDVDVTGRSQS